MALITPLNARILAAKSAEARRLNPLRSVPPGYKLVPAEYPEHVPASDDYAHLVLARTRTQLDLVSKQITEELEKPKLDSRRLRDLTDAQTRLAEQERILAGRPLPGSRRPAADREARPTAEVVGPPRAVAPVSQAAPQVAQVATAETPVLEPASPPEAPKTDALDS